MVFSKWFFLESREEDEGTYHKVSIKLAFDVGPGDRDRWIQEEYKMQVLKVNTTVGAHTFPNFSEKKDFSNQGYPSKVNASVIMLTAEKGVPNSSPMLWNIEVFTCIFIWCVCGHGHGVRTKVPQCACRVQWATCTSLFRPSTLLRQRVSCFCCSVLFRWADIWLLDNSCLLVSQACVKVHLK